MSTEAGTLEVVELDAVLDWDPVCTWGGLRESGVQVSYPGCEQRADWIGTTTCCRMVRFYCSQHRAARDQFTLTHPKAIHTSCGAPGAPISWSPMRGSR